MSKDSQYLTHRAKALLKNLAHQNEEMAQMVVAMDDEGGQLPDWFLLEIIRDLPRLIRKDKTYGKCS